MNWIADVLVGLVAALHLFFLVLEMFLWDTPTGRRVFGLDPEFATASSALAANQGLYNGFLAAGLAYSLIVRSPVDVHFQVFFLGCVLLAGLYGGFTASRRILVFQALPAAVALALVVLAR